MEEKKVEDASSSLKLGFLSYCEFRDKKVYCGGILITDEHGKPLEFRATSPVRPNPLQRILYGKRLLPHILLELIGKPLVKAIKETPACFLVKDEDFLRLRESAGRTIIFLRPQGKIQSSIKQLSSTLLESDDFKPIVVEGCNPDEVTEWREKLQGVFKYMDLLEPFERVDKALEEIDKQKILDKE